MIECRCKGCKRRLFDMEYGRINIVCYKCKTLNIFALEKPTGADPQTSLNNHEETANHITLPDKS